MRVIKYEVWCLQTEQMYKVHEISLAMGTIIASKTGNVEDYIQLPWDSSEMSVLREYTGCNIGETEVYEGDIIEYDKHLYDKEMGKRTGEVKFYDGGFKVNHVDLSGIVNESGDVTFRPKVIGNIHENPELLK